MVFILTVLTVYWLVNFAFCNDISNNLVNIVKIFIPEYEVKCKRNTAIELDASHPRAVPTRGLLWRRNRGIEM